ncbi:GGDEF domain-containing protein [Vibrio ruber]|uniref:GGDEF domain-containing protein n=1 Tax=Vibrio ruber TaxID=184755 RepID=UPI002893602A|nr:GGDEF domain-containing protein [Vibrio ruber]WNJ97510.1 GGDEF domain-containing protein [Vibrio ruber]
MFSMSVSSSWFRSLLPILFIVAIHIGMGHEIFTQLSNSNVLLNLPYVLLFTALAVAQIFKQSRMGMLAIAQILAYAIIQLRLQTPLISGSTLLELSLLALLFPISCVICYAFHDSDLFTKEFLYYLIIQCLFFVWSLLILDYFNQGDFPDLFTQLLSSVPQVSRLPFILFLYLIVLSGITMLLLLRKNRKLDAIVYTSVLLISDVFVSFHMPHISSILFSISGIFLVLYVIAAGHEMAFNDRLTHLPGRAALDHTMKSLGRHFTIAMIDVDHFKQFNDNYGHDTGDEVLKLVASKLRQVKGKAKAYRYGGEEFTIIFKGKSTEEAFDYLESLRQEIQNYDMYLRNTDKRPKSDKMGRLKRQKDQPSNVVNITVSIGVSDSRSSRNPQEVIKSADQALYKAKKSGRNRVTV